MAYQATCVIAVTASLGFTKFFGNNYATLADATAAATTGVQALQNQLSLTGLLAPIYITVDLNDGVSMPIRLRSAEVIALLPNCGQV